MFANRSVFGGTVGPNPLKPTTTTESQFYDGIKMRAQPLPINVQAPPLSATAIVQTTPVKTVRRKGQVLTAPSTTPSISVVPDVASDTTTITTPPASPASPILKAQLSAPPKQRDTVSKGEVKSQVILTQTISHLICTSLIRILVNCDHAMSHSFAINTT